jgi:L-alanine-DL-glutamate epimerase-like enolase superfamily enzyme
VEFFNANRYTNTTIRTFQEETGRRFMPHSIRPVKGWIDLPTVPGLGFDPDLEAVEAYRRKYGTITSEVARRTSRPVNHNLYLSL